MQRILQEITKKEIKLGTSDAWSMRRSSQQPSDPAYYIEDCRISRGGLSTPPPPDGPVCTPTRLLLCQCASECMSILMTDPLDNRSASTFYMYVLLLRFVVCTVRTVVIQDLDFWQIARIHTSIISFLIDCEYTANVLSAEFTDECLQTKSKDN